MTRDQPRASRFLLGEAKDYACQNLACHLGVVVANLELFTLEHSVANTARL